MGNKLDKVMNMEVGQTFESDGVNSSIKEVKGQVVVTQEDLEKMNALPEEAKAEKALDENEVEKQLVAEEKNRLDSFLKNEEEMSLMVIKLLIPKFRDAVSKLPARGLKRVLKSLVEYPLHDYSHPNATEQQAVSLGKALCDAKMVLMYHTYNENKDTILEMALEDAAKNTVTEFGDAATSLANEVNNG